MEDDMLGTLGDHHVLMIDRIAFCLATTPYCAVLGLGEVLTKRQDSEASRMAYETLYAATQVRARINQELLLDWNIFQRAVQKDRGMEKKRPDLDRVELCMTKLGTVFNIMIDQHVRLINMSAKTLFAWDEDILLEERLKAICDLRQIRVYEEAYHSAAENFFRGLVEASDRFYGHTLIRRRSAGIENVDFD